MSASTVPERIVIERIVPHAREKVWRALTQPWLIEDWLMPNDFQPQVGHQFSFRSKPVGGWSGVTHCKVMAISEPESLSYTWNDDDSDGLRTLVTWTLEEVDDGTLVRMEQSGFRPQDADAYRGLSGGWPHIIQRLGHVAGTG